MPLQATLTSTAQEVGPVPEAVGDSPARSLVERLVQRHSRAIPERGPAEVTWARSQPHPYYDANFHSVVILKINLLV